MAKTSNGTITMVAETAITVFSRVKLGTASREVVESVATDKAAYLGTALNAAAIGESVTIKLKNAEGTHKCRASGAVLTNVPIYSADDGEITSSANGSPIGSALEAASGDGSIIECVLHDQVAVV